MDTNENFGHINIDRPPAIPGWSGPVPYLDYLYFHYHNAKLSEQQSDFYDLVKQSIADEVKINADIKPYLSLYRDELIQQIESHRDEAEALNRFKTMYRLYGYRDYGIDRYMNAEILRIRANRLFRLKRTPKARWIPVGESCEVDGVQLSRGGFYLGNHLELSMYDPGTHTFSATKIPVEGPVLNLDKESYGTVDKEFITEYTTFAEMNDKAQSQLIDWLAGADVDNIDALRYYFAGIEFRLLCDDETTNDQRKTLLQYLIQRFPDSGFKVNLPYMRFVNEIYHLIDFTLARHFIDDAEDVLPLAYVENAPFLRAARLHKALGGKALKINDTEAIIANVKHIFRPPHWLPQVYTDAYNQRLASEIATHLKVPKYMFGKDYLKYEPLGSYPEMNPAQAYKPSAVLADALKSTTINAEPYMVQLVERLMGAYQAVVRELDPFKKGYINKMPPLSFAGYLPGWCDPALLPELSALKSKIAPMDHEGLRSIKLSDLLEIVNFQQKTFLNIDEMHLLNQKLSVIGLRVGCAASGSVKFNGTDTVAVYSSDLGEASTRGSLLSAIFFLSWMLAADNIDDNLLAMADNWIIEKCGNVQTAIPFMANLRWLASRKLVMSRRRKSKAAAFVKFTKQRADLVDFMLTLVSDPEVGTPKRMKRLETLYTLIGLDPSTIHSDIHRMVTASGVAQRKIRANSSSTVSLDKSKLLEISRSTERAQEILADVFVAQEDNKPEAVPETAADDPTISMLKLLINKPQWSRGEFESLCAQRRETVGSMLERLNDYSYDHADEAVAEDDDDVIYIDLDVARQLINI